MHGPYLKLTQVATVHDLTIPSMSSLPLLLSFGMCANFVSIRSIKIFGICMVVLDIHTGLAM